MDLFLYKGYTSIKTTVKTENRGTFVTRCLTGRKCACGKWRKRGGIGGRKRGIGEKVFKT